MSRPTAFLLAGLIAAAGCAPKDRELRLARVAAQGRNLEVTLDRLEDRLLVSQARVRLWREMRERHESVSAVACASQEEHAEEMALHALPEQDSPAPGAGRGRGARRGEAPGADDGEPVGPPLPRRPARPPILRGLFGFAFRGGRS